MVFRMIHEFRIPDPTNGKRLVFGLPEFLGGGWTNPFEKYARELGSSSQVAFKKKHETTTYRGLFNTWAQTTVISIGWNNNSYEGYKV